MKFGYFDHNQRQITEARWRELCKEEGYVTLKRFRDERVHIEARWIGKLENPQNHFPNLRPIFAMLMWNRNSAGEWVQDPHHGTKFCSKAKLLQEYNDYLLEWTKTTLDDEGNMLEVGNELDAPPTADITAPGGTKVSSLVGVSQEVSSVGVW